MESGTCHGPWTVVTLWGGGQPQVASHSGAVHYAGLLAGWEHSVASGPPVSVTASSPQQRCPPRKTFESFQSNHGRCSFGLWCSNLTVSECCSRDV